MDAGEDEPFEVQTAEDIRLTRNKDQLLLHNVATGEVAVVEESKNWTSVELLTVDGEGVVLRGSAWKQQLWRGAGHVYFSLVAI